MIHTCDLWGLAFVEIQKARQENRSVDTSKFFGLTKAPGETARCPKCGEKL